MTLSVLPGRSENCPSLLVTEAWMAGEAQAREVSEHIATCAGCRGYVEGLREGQARFLADRPAGPFLSQISSRAQVLRPRAFAAPKVLGAVALALAASLVVGLWPAPEEAVRLKGPGFAAVYFRSGMEGPAEVTPELRLQPGDDLRFSYVAPGGGYLAVLELDGRGKASAFFPFGGAQSVRVDGDGFVPGSVALDDAPGPAWLVAVFSPSPQSVTSLLRQLGGTAPGLAPQVACEGCRVETLRVQKR